MHNLKLLGGTVVVLILGVIGTKLIFLTHASQLDGDANGNGVVNISDLSILAAHYGMTSGATWSMGDFNSDEAVNLNGLAILAAHYGDTLSSLPAVPAGLSATASSSSAVSLSWTADSSSGGTITYLIYRNSTSNQSSAVDVTTEVPGSLQPVGNDPGPWSLTFDSDFTGSSLNTSQWSTGWFGSGITGPINLVYENGVYSPTQVTVGDGALSLTAIAQQNTNSNGTYQYTSGAVTTMAPAYPWTAPVLFSLTYGYMEAKIWLSGSTSIADWPAFWAHGFSDDETDGEIDVLEGLNGQACAHFHNTAGATGDCATGTFTGGWHTFAAD